MTPALLTCAHVSRTFGTGHRAVVAVHDVSCAVTAGSRIGVVGPSGSGKSSLFHLLAGLDEPSQGAIERSPELAGRASQHVGVVFQGPSLVPALTAQENVAFPLVLQGVRHREAQATALAAMRRLQIDGLADQLPEELSGGQAQRVAVARVLVSRPPVILADEPTGRLDQQSAHIVVDVLLETADELGAALLIATHDPRVAARLTTCWRMSDGRLTVMPDVADRKVDAP